MDTNVPTDLGTAAILNIKFGIKDLNADSDAAAVHEYVGLANSCFNADLGTAAVLNVGLDTNGLGQIIAG